MKKMVNLKNKLSKICGLAYNLFFGYEGVNYVIEEINVKTQMVSVRCVGSRIIIKLTIESLIADNVIVGGLCAKQACKLGGYYGRLLHASLEGREALKKVKKMFFLLNNGGRRYTISFQDRNGDLGYYDKKARKAFVDCPLNIVNSDYIISGFDSSEACYIGILVGVDIEKKLSSGRHFDMVNSFIRKPPKLRVVS